MMKGKRTWKILWMLLILVLMAGNMVTASSNDKYKLRLKEGTYYYTKAYEMLPMINEERKKNGLNPLEMDVELMQAAMQRAAEIVVDFSHTRPDGSSCFTISQKAFGENIAAGYSTAEGTFNQWMNSPGHRANMMSARFRSVGIGCFTNGYLYFWVQLFSDGTALTGQKLANQKVKPEVSIVEGMAGLGFNLNQAEEYYTKLKSGQTLQLEAGRINPGWDYCYAEFDSESFYWSSSNEAIATVNQRGQVQATGSGTAVIQAVPKNGGGEGASVTITCQADSQKTFSAELSKKKLVYTGKKQTPEIIVKDGKKILEKGIHYTVSYTQNVNVGYGTATIIGNGNYEGTTKTLKFMIIPKKMAFKYVKSTKETGLTLKWKQDSQVSGYQIQVSLDKKFKSGVKKLNVRDKTIKSCSVQNMISKKTYYVRIRSYRNISGKALYGSWSKVYSVVIK